MSAPIVTFDRENAMLVKHPEWDHGLKIVRGVVLIDSKDLLAAEHHGWQSMPRATSKREVELGLIRVMRL